MTAALLLSICSSNTESTGDIFITQLV